MDIIEILDLIKIKRNHFRDEWINAILSGNKKRAEKNHQMYQVMDDLFEQILYAALNRRD